MADKLDKKRIALDAVVIGMNAKISDLTKQLIDAKSELDKVIDQAITDGTADIKSFKNTTACIEMFSAILTELSSRQKVARKALWDYDLTNASDEYSTAANNATETRLKFARCQDDRAKYMRTPTHIKPEERIKYVANLEFKLVEAKKCSHQAELIKNQKKMALETLKAAFNEVALELDEQPKTLLSIEGRLSGR